MLDEGGDVGAEEVLAVTEPDDERGVAACADDDAGAVGVHREQGERALETADHGAHRLGEVAEPVVLAADEHGGDLGVGLGAELDALGQQLPLQVGEVLDDPVVDHREPLVVAARCGCALPSVGPPWVAQRV